MKKLRKVAGLLLALALAMVTLLGTGTAVRADDTSSTTENSLTITNTGDTDHTFELYQIFTGDYDKDSESLSNLQWGSGVTTEGKKSLGAAADKAAKLTEANVEDFAHELEGYLTSTPTKKSDTIPPSNSYTFTDLAAGYYLVIDEAGTQTNKKEELTLLIF